MTQPGIEPRSPGPLAKTLTTRPMSASKMGYLMAKCQSFVMVNFGLFV